MPRSVKAHTAHGDGKPNTSVFGLSAERKLSTKNIEKFNSKPLGKILPREVIEKLL